MKKKILLPGWNSCSPKKQELIKIWVESVLQAQAASKALIAVCNSEDVAEESVVTLSQAMHNAVDNKKDFEIIEFDDNSEEVMKLAELPYDFSNELKELLKWFCLKDCESRSNQNEQKKCRENCNQK
ncbi:MAG: hypothetical protein U7123_23510 [Potamolinea sp.]